MGEESEDSDSVEEPAPSWSRRSSSSTSVSVREGRVGCLSLVVVGGGEDLLDRTNLRIWDVLGILEEVAWNLEK